MMIQRRQRTTREVTGPTPHSVAVFARPTNKVPPEHLILERRAKDDQRRQAELMSKSNKLFDLKNDWERWTDKKIQINTVKNRVRNLMQASKHDVEDRRERLRIMLAEEHKQHLEEMEAAEETVLERQAKMREKARILKERREMERQNVVQQKLQEQWRNQCEELRGTMSKRHQDLVAAERIEQLRHKELTMKKLEQEEQMYADLWHADMLAKAKKEEEDTKRQMSANRETVGVLQQQMAALEAKRQEEKKLIEEEAALMKEQAELRKMEELKALEEKRNKQQRVAAMYDKSLRMKKEKEARDLQEQLAFDMKILEQLLEESRNEAMEQTQRKKEMRDEDHRYRAYLAEMKREDAERERELERLCDAEVEKTWEKKVKQWKLEKEARRKLLQEVMESRRQQLQHKMNENMRRQAEAAEERDQLLRKIEENKRIEREQAYILHMKNQNYQQDLINQMHYNNSMRKEDLDEEERIWQMQQDAEKEYQVKLQLALDNPIAPKMHPIRKWALSKSDRSGGMN